MDIRGIEITNQLRSAIRAKLLELGVRYDEELPDYILVMVVNKKTRQQMNKDLQLFLEGNTETFVNWLHDQVLKKLQKVTVSKKKNNNQEAVSLLPVKKEEDQKKIKDEDKPSSSVVNVQPAAEVITKQERDREFEELVGDLAMLNEDNNKLSFKDLKASSNKSNQRLDALSLDSESEANNFEKNDSSILPITKTTPSRAMMVKKKTMSIKQSQSKVSLKENYYFSPLSTKRKSTSNENSHKINESPCKRIKITFDSGNNNDKPKFTVTKPKVTSVVTVKNRFDNSPIKNPEVPTKLTNDRSVESKKYSDTQRGETASHQSSSDRSKEKDQRRQIRSELRSTSGRDESYIRLKSNELKKVVDLREKVRLNSKPGTVKFRPGIISNSQTQDQSLLLKSSSTIKESKFRISNVKSRLGAKVQPQSNSLLKGASKLSQSTKESYIFQERDTDVESLITTPLKSQIIAINKPKSQITKEKTPKILKRQIVLGNNNKNQELILKDTQEDKKDQSKLPSKVIVTPRPLKPLQPFQKRATQSLLLRAVQEANKSVVMQKKMDPCLKEQRPTRKIKITRDLKKGKVLAINLNSKNRSIEDRIQVELANRKRKKAKNARVTDADMDVVKSLLRKSRSKQKILVTLNSCNNVQTKKNSDEDQLELQVSEEEEEFKLEKADNNFEIQDEVYDENDEMIEYTDDQDFEHDDNYDNYVTYEDNIDHELRDIYGKVHYVKYISENSKNNIADESRREEKTSNKNIKNIHSPIIFTRSRSNSPVGKFTVASTVSSVLYTDKRPLISSVVTTVTDKSSEKCRYWPNCTLGIKCAYYHPDVTCSSFPACKFGDKCAYKHPKCKFGSACTKIGCIFSHPPVQCKYHPYCMKPSCPFSHPQKNPTSMSPLTPLPDVSSQRAKFKWIKKK